MFVLLMIQQRQLYRKVSIDAFFETFI